MRQEKVPTKLTRMLLRLGLHTAASVVIYFTVRDNFFYQDNNVEFTIDTSNSTEGWSLAQIGFWILTLIVESEANKELTDQNTMDMFIKKRKKIKYLNMFYCLVAIATILSTVDCYYNPENHYLFNDSTLSQDSNGNFKLYCFEAALSVVIFAYAMHAYKREVRQLNEIMYQLVEPLIGGQAQAQQNQAGNRQQQQRRPGVVADRQQQPQPQPQVAGAAAAAGGAANRQAQNQGQINNNNNDNSNNNNRFRMSVSILGEQAQQQYNQECPICMDAFSPTDHIIELPCLHTYHSNCIRSWTVRSCPQCRLAY